MASPQHPNSDGRQRPGHPVVARPPAATDMGPILIAVDEQADALASRISSPGSGAGWSASDKSPLHDLGGQLELPTPRGRAVASQNWLDGAASFVTFSGCSEVADPTLWRTRSVAIAHPPDELLHYVGDTQAQPDATNLLLQQYLPGGSDSHAFSAAMSAETRTFSLATRPKRCASIRPAAGSRHSGVRTERADPCVDAPARDRDWLLGSDRHRLSLWR